MIETKIIFLKRLLSAILFYKHSEIVKQLKMTTQVDLENS